MKYNCLTITFKLLNMSSLEFDNKLTALESILLSFAINLTKNIDDAKDLLQETSIRALKNKDKFRTGTNLKAWLFTIMKNIFINNYRKRAKKNTLFDSSDNMYLINSSDIDIRNGGEQMILNEELNNILEEIDDSVKIPFLMHFEGYKYQEISEKLDLPLGTVKSRIFFARKELKIRIQRDYNENLKASYQAFN